jgi:hypothetical protein
MKSADWKHKMKGMGPSYGESLEEQRRHAPRGTYNTFRSD